MFKNLVFLTTQHSSENKVFFKKTVNLLEELLITDVWTPNGTTETLCLFHILDLNCPSCQWLPLHLEHY